MYANPNIPGYTLMVAGQRSGKTSFLRLLLDTSNIAPTVSKEQLTPLAKFIQGSSGHTSHIRHVSVDVILDSPDSGTPQPVSLTLIDTPSLDFSDEVSSERVITDILDHIDSRFADSPDDVSPLPHPPRPVRCVRHVIPTLRALPFVPSGCRKRTEIITFTCKYPVFILDAYFHSRCMRSGAYHPPLPHTDVYTSWIRITSFLRNSFHPSTLPHFGPDLTACHRPDSPLFLTPQ